MRSLCTRPFATILPALLLCVATPTFAADKTDAVAPAAAAFTPGKETKILDAETGGLGWYVVYVPKDYTPDRDWPTIICYHGKNNDPKTYPFKELTDGQGFIVIGMEYLDRESPKPEPEVENLKRIMKFVTSKLRVNSKLTFMGGFSQGGWSTSSFSNVYGVDQLAGLIITGAGGSPGEKAAPLLKGKPVFVGIGTEDPANPNAKSSRDAYTAKGAAVTFEEFKGLAHAIDTKNKALKEWLTKWGPQNQMIAAVGLAKAAEKAGKLGEAYVLYSNAGKMTGGEEAAAQAKAIGDPAEKKLADAEAALEAKRYPDAVKLLVATSDQYAGSPFGETAKQRVQQIRTDPAIKAAIEQAKVDARADALEADARAADKAKDFAKAIPLYETFVVQFPSSAHAAAVKARLDELKADKTIVASAKGQAADRECKGWLSTADNYIKNDMNDKAKPYLQKIIEKYGDTPWADQAKKRLGEIR